MIKTEKLSRYALNTCIVIILVIFALFFGVGYDNPQGDYNAPQFTEVLMYLMYILTAVTALLAVWSAIKSVKDSMGGNAENLSGVPGGKISVFAVIVMLASLAIGFFPNMNETEFVTASGAVTSPTMVTITDMFIISIYIMLAVAALAVIVNMTGVIKKSGMK